MMLPKRLQTAHTILRAVNIETARVADHVSGELQGRMRLMWWREAVEAACAGRNGPSALPATYHTPVVLALSALAKNSPALDAGLLDRLVEARIAELDPSQPQEIYGLEQYAEQTQSTMLYLLLQCAGYEEPIDPDAAVCRAASHIGNALGLTILLQAAPYLATQRQCPLPQTIMAHHSVPTEDFYRAALAPSDTIEGGAAAPGSEAGVVSPDLIEVFYDVAGNAAVHLEHARSLQSDVPKEYRSLLLPAVLADDYLNKLQVRLESFFDQIIIVVQRKATLRLASPAHLPHF